MTSIAAAYGAWRLRAKARGAKARGTKTGGLLLLAAIVLLTSPSLARTTPRLLVLGDSLTAGYGLAHDDGFQTRLAASLAADGHAVRIIDAAVSGDTSAGGRARLEWALAEGADAVFLELGGNDGLRGLDPRATEQNLAAILDALAARKIPVLLSGMRAPPNLGPDYGAEFLAVFHRLGARPGVIFDPFFLESVAADPTLNQPDGIHPNPAGVKKIVARLLPLVEKLIARAQRPKARPE